MLPHHTAAKSGWTIDELRSVSSGRVLPRLKNPAFTMPIQRSQGRRRPQVPRADELAAGVPAPSRVPDAATAEALAGVERAPSGQVANSESAAALGRLGGLAKAERDRVLAETPALARRLGLRGVEAVHFKAYIDDAHEFAERECERLAGLVGGGVCGYGPSSMVQSAALQLAASRYCFDRGELVAGSRLADASRANLMSARDECAREAEARGGGTTDPADRWRRKP